MSAVNINRVTLTGNLTADPELRALPSGTNVASLRLAVNARRKDGTGEWVDQPNYFNITAWGATAENAAKFLSKGSPIAVDGRLEWQEYRTQSGEQRQAVKVVAQTIQFLGSRTDGGGGRFQPEQDFDPDVDKILDAFPGSSDATGTDDDIPF